MDPDRPATLARARARKRRQAEGAARSAIAAPIEQVMRVAVALEVHTDPAQAVAFAGLDVPPPDAAALARAARDLYPDGVNNAALSALVRANLGSMLLDLWRATAHLKPDYIAGGVRALGQLLGMLASGENAPSPGNFVFQLTSSSGATISVLRDPAAVVRPAGLSGG